MLSDEQREIQEMVRTFADREILPVAEEYDSKDLYPEEIVEGMKETGLFGAMIDEEWGGMGLDLLTYCLIVEELSRGWISVSGIINTHFIGVYLLQEFGTPEQQERFLPRMATGELRAAFSISEPESGSDAQSIKTYAQPDGDDWLLSGQKMWVTNGLGSSLVFLLVRTDTEADPPHRGMSCFITEKTPWERNPAPGFQVSEPIRKMGYKGVESTELVYDEYRCPGNNLLGGEPGRGFAQMMNALEVGRVNVAARGVGIAQRALELALQYSQERRTFGKPIREHQAVSFRLADMATGVEAARQLTRFAASEKDRTGQAAAAAGMAKLFASETARQVVEDAFRIHGGYGYSKEYEIERLYRDAPLLLIGEGTSDIQKLLISRSL